MASPLQTVLHLCPLRHMCPPGVQCSLTPRLDLDVEHLEQLPKGLLEQYSSVTQGRFPHDKVQQSVVPHRHKCFLLHPYWVVGAYLTVRKLAVKMRGTRVWYRQVHSKTAHRLKDVWILGW